MEHTKDTLDVTETLLNVASKFPSAEVDRADNLTYDLANLMACDPTPLDIKSLRENVTTCLDEAAREATQLLYNKLFQLPTANAGPEVIGVLAQLPKPITIIPREKHIPQARPETKWEKFAKVKGITKKKKERMAFDDSTGELRPRYGFNRNDDLNDEWVIESKPNDDPEVDPFTAKEQKKKEKVTKQSNREKANKMQGPKPSGVAASTAKLPGTIAITNDYQTSLESKKANLETSLANARKSTISMGKFDRLLPGEKALKERKKFASNTGGGEKDSNMKVLDKVMGDNDTTPNFSKAVNKVIATQQAKRGMHRQEKPKRKKK